MFTFQNHLKIMEGQSLTQGGLLIHWESQHFLSFVSAQFPGFTARSVVRENHDRLTSKQRIHPTYDAEKSCHIKPLAHKLSCDWLNLLPLIHSNFYT